MAVHPLAGRPVPSDRLASAAALVRAYHEEQPAAGDAAERVSFGTSGHRGSSLQRSFNEAHIAAICQAVAELRRQHGVSGPLFLGMDTHALSRPAFETALAVLHEHGVQVVLDSGSEYSPTPVISHAILGANRNAYSGLADGVIITPSHNPPEDGGIKYNPPSGGPADTDVTSAIEARANELLATGGVEQQRVRGQARRVEAQRAEVERAEAQPARAAATSQRRDLRAAYVADLAAVLDMDAIAGAGLRIGVDPLGGSSVEYWPLIAERYGLDIEVVNPRVDPSFGFMTLDWDGKVRMDCSSPHAMAGLIGLKDRFDIAFGLDPDADRHGIVTPSAGLLNPNHYLSVAVWYLFQHRPEWSASTGIGKTLVSSSMIDRVAAHLQRRLVEVPVGFKWFVDGLVSGSIGFGGEESAGATFLRRDGTPWTTDKDGILLCLLAAEITAKLGREPGELYRELEAQFGSPVYERVDAPANAAQKAALKQLSPDAVRARELAGDEIVARLTRAPGNDAAIGGLKVVTRNGWFAARPSGTEDVYKIYAESFIDEAHLRRIQEEARSMVSEVLGRAGA